MSLTEPSQPPPTAPPLLPRSTPEEQGIPSDAVLAMVRRWEGEGNEPHGVVVLRHGHVVAEGAWQPWPRDGIRLVYSVSKTFLAIAAAFAEAEGLLARDERLVDVFPEAAGAAGPARRPDHRRGLPADVDRSPHRHPRHRARPRRRGRGVGGPVPRAEPEEEPGSWFLYHNGASRMLALAVQRRTGERLVDYLRPRLLDPLGIREAVWTRWAGADLGFSGLHISTDTIARLGLLLLHDGSLGGPPGAARRLGRDRHRAPLADTTHHPDPVDWTVGYGYQMWRSRHGFRADGAYGQFALVLPEHDLVVAVTSCTETTHEVLDAVWDELLPHLGDAPLPADPEPTPGSTAPSTRPRRRRSGSTATAPAAPTARGGSPTPPRPSTRP